MSRPAQGGHRSPRTAVVVGAGPYGLSAAAHLRAAGLSVRAFGDPMHSWRDTMPAGMCLKSTPDASTISAPAPGHSLPDFCRANGETEPRGHDRVPVELFTRYGSWFQQELVPYLERDTVVAVRQSGSVDGWFEVTLDSGETFPTHAVVVASGLTGFAHVPRLLAGVAPEGPGPDAPVSHSSQHADPAALAGRSVLVVGAGQSALEGAALLHESGAQVELVARTPRIRFGAPPADGLRWQPESPMGPAWSLWAMARYPQAFRSLPQQVRLRLVKQVLGPSGSWWLRPRADGVFPMHAGQQLRTVRREGDKVVLTTSGPGGATREFTADHVLAATGYRVDLTALPFLSTELRARLDRVGGFPALDEGMCSTVPGLYFTGLPAAACFGPFMRFVCGTEFASARIASALTGRFAR
ncbi:FAD-dependent oxidoreductase [Streptacidiphilus rugosus]|uniref:FAD-dependent oxidoreductase n=1 Tax=Streptacidiphilus rugosus TaxID=405783 RepID=UPI000689923C|nr:FAD-dependent oxidoreductase [Streptacidiphilus rugosus]